MTRNLMTLLGFGFISTWAAAAQNTAPTATPTATPPAAATAAVTNINNNTGQVNPAAQPVSTAIAPVSIGDQNKQAGQSFLAANKSQQGVITTNSGLQYKVIDMGTGAKPAANDTVIVEYEGKHLDGRIFDSSYQRGQPATFPVAAVIPGWQEALQMMPAGSTWMLYIPAELAYGERGAPGAIAPNETLVFKVHLVDVKKSA